MSDNEDEVLSPIEVEFQNNEIDNKITNKYQLIRMIFAGISSILYPGLGQIYNGQVKKGIKFMLVPYAGFL